MYIKIFRFLEGSGRSVFCWWVGYLMIWPVQCHTTHVSMYLLRSIEINMLFPTNQARGSKNIKNSSLKHRH
eukprot:TRINITY_DN8462_c0_g1_i1.p1 TRINITY_DN8462_c0_g1~~TRINITY_DN8462_c0_g1_i1.p1  ORF type:complete len:71 (+),score=1.81 TRINITY_DN8462_c0_g1_i1:56-268(+)